MPHPACIPGDEGCSNGAIRVDFVDLHRWTSWTPTVRRHLEACDAAPIVDAQDDALCLTAGDAMRQPHLCPCQHVGRCEFAVVLARRSPDDAGRQLLRTGRVWSTNKNEHTNVMG